MERRASDRDRNLRTPPILIRSAVPGIVWPAIANPNDATALALQYQLEHLQWLDPERMRELQFRQLDALVRHAYESVPYYRSRWGGIYEPRAVLTAERFARLPVLGRSELQEHFDALKCTQCPPAHGAVVESRTTGSTGAPVRTLSTALVGLWWRALTLRDSLWHRRDFSGKLAAIRMKVPEQEGVGWGPATNPIATIGRSATLPVGTEVDAQLEWLARQQPDYLLTYPSNLAALAKRSMERGVRLPRLREARSMGEVLGPETRALCKEAWGVPVVDAYSSDEVGYIALQCPESEHYHVQSESVLVEVLDEGGRACGPGALGRVVVTTLHNFAMPLVRYDIGDYAEVGERCRCRRGLPVLTRIAGRARNMLVLADGRRYWPALGSRRFVEVAPVLQAQFVQKDYDLIEVRLVTAEPLSAEQEERLRQFILPVLPTEFRLVFVYCESIPRGAGGKFEDFVSEVAVRS